MSRTDKTDPLWVRMMDPLNRLEVREVHDHTRGPCDIDTWNPKETGFWYRKGGQCYKTPYPIRKLYCGCSWCHRDPWSNWHGAHRAEWRAQRQAWLHGWGEDRVERHIPDYK